MLNKLIVTQTAKYIPHSLCNTMVDYRIQKRPPWVPIQSQMNPFKVLKSVLISLSCNSKLRHLLIMLQLCSYHICKFLTFTLFVCTHQTEQTPRCAVPLP